MPTPPDCALAPAIISSLVSDGYNHSWVHCGYAQKREESLPTAMKTDWFLDVGSVRVRIRRGGSGTQQVLLLHGWGGSIESMSAIFDDLTQTRDVVAIDFPGQGQSSVPPEAWGISEYTECLLRIMDALSFRRPDIIAHSFGGRVAIKLASSHPERVGRLVLVDAAGIPPRRKPIFYLKRSIAQVGRWVGRRFGRAGELLRIRIYGLIASKDYYNAGPMRSTFVRIINEDLTTLLPTIKAVTLLVWGERDMDTPLSSGQRMKELIPKSDLVILKDAGHFSYIDQFGMFRLIVNRFLRETNV
jgi:pimeloyl-ACP methyl ester carboxylesterase